MIIITQYDMEEMLSLYLRRDAFRKFSSLSAHPVQFLWAILQNPRIWLILHALEGDE